MHTATATGARVFAAVALAEFIWLLFLAWLAWQG